MKDILQQLRSGLGRGPLTPWGKVVTDAANEIETLRNLSMALNRKLVLAETDLSRLWHFAGCPLDHCQRCIDDAEFIKSLHNRLGSPSEAAVRAQHEDR